MNAPGGNSVGNTFFIEATHLQNLLEILQGRGFVVLGPVVRQGEKLLAEVQAAADLPVGWTAEQEAGVFRLSRREDQAYFGYWVGQHSLKQFFFPPAVRLWEARREEDSWRIETPQEETPRYAFIGVRACDLAALDVQDRVFVKGRHLDPIYAERRQQAFVVAVQCTESGGTCFCASMGTGPRAVSGFDLALTEVLRDKQHFFLVEVGTAQGAEVLSALPHRPATAEEVAAASRLVAEAAKNQKRSLETSGLKEFLYNNYENSHWEQVAARCLSCGNCALSCPTCFCHSYQDSLDVTGMTAERWRRWEVCFSLEFSYIHGGPIRPSVRSRYRQWLTHKLATWVDQFGCLGCVGCGRCITWCPVGIDLTQEVPALKETAARGENASATEEKKHGEH